MKIEYITLITTFVTLLTGFIGAFIVLIGKVRKLRTAIRRKCIVVGVLHTVPSGFAKYPDITSLNETKNYSSTIFVMRCRTLSYALRKCDFVCCDSDYRDPKIYPPGDVFWEELLAGTEKLQQLEALDT